MRKKDRKKKVSKANGEWIGDDRESEIQLTGPFAELVKRVEARLMSDTERWAEETDKRLQLQEQRLSDKLAYRKAMLMADLSGKEDDSKWLEERGIVVGGLVHNPMTGRNTDLGPTNALAGTEAKIRVFRERVRLKRVLFHPDDPDYGRK